MHMSKFNPRIFLFILMTSCATSAQAAVITNLENAPVTIEVESGDGYKPVTIDSYATWRVQGKVRVRYKDRESWISNDEEYAIWQNSGLGPQKRSSQHGGHY